MVWSSMVRYVLVLYGQYSIVKYGMLLCLTRTAGVVDVVYVNIVT